MIGYPMVERAYSSCYGSGFWEYGSGAGEGHGYGVGFACNGKYATGYGFRNGNGCGDGRSFEYGLKER
jgi:hypothetical protein